MVYWQASRQLTDGQGLSYVDSHNRIGAQYYTLHSFKVFHPNQANRFFDYPPGLPALASLTTFLFQSQDVTSPFIPLTAALAILALYAFSLVVVGPRVAWWAGLVLLANPTFLANATSIWSETLSAGLILLGIVGYLAAARYLVKPWPRVLVSVVAGIALGFAFFTRFTNLTVVPAVLVLVAMTRSGARPRSDWSTTWPYLATIAAGVIAVLGFNTLYYGGPVTTAYSPLHGWYTQPPFSLSYAFGPSFAGGRCVPALLQTVGRDFGLLLAFALVGLLVSRNGLKIGLIVLIGCLVLPYTIYLFAPQGVNKRFLLRPILQWPRWWA